MIKSWSPSRLFDYEQCPRRVKYKSVDQLCPTCFEGKMIWVGDKQTCDVCNVQPVESPALDRGTRIHAAAENYITGRRQDIDKDLENVAHWLELLRAEYRARRVRVESFLAVDKNWKPVGWKDSGAWLRAKIDILWIFEDGQALVIDWKTGKLKDVSAYDSQLGIYSLISLCSNLNLMAAQAKLIFTDYVPEKQEVDSPKSTVTIDTLEKEKSWWERRVKPMLNDEIFMTSPGNHCRWCDYSCNKGGPCDF